jgi:hypothetical protein
MANPSRFFSGFASRNLHDKVAPVSDAGKQRKQNRDLRIARSQRNGPAAAHPILYMYAAYSVAIGRNFFADIVPE